jgi:hypothetical protein
VNHPADSDVEYVTSTRICRGTVCMGGGRALSAWGRGGTTARWVIDVPLGARGLCTVSFYENILIPYIQILPSSI